MYIHIGSTDILVLSAANSSTIKDRLNIVEKEAHPFSYAFSFTSASIDKKIIVGGGYQFNEFACFLLFQQ